MDAVVCKKNVEKLENRCSPRFGILKTFCADRKFTQSEGEPPASMMIVDGILLQPGSEKYRFFLFFLSDHTRVTFL